ncbi:MAG: sigma-70 family RNA polymerase sigma factor [Planctomycetota bacterium]
MKTVSAKNDSFSEALNYSDSLYRAAYYLAGSPVEVNDMVQEVYLKAYTNWDKFKPGTNCKAWLFTILHNNWINWLNKEAKKPAALPPEQLESLPVKATTPAVELRTVVEKMVGDEIQSAIKRLPTEYIDTLIMAWVGEFSYAEISEISGCPVGTVMSRLHRARVLLREFLSEYNKKNSPK